HINHVVEEFPTELLNAGLTVHHTTCIEVHEVMPAAGEITPGSDLDHRHFLQPVGRAATSREAVQGHAGRELQRPADEVAGRGGGKVEAGCGAAFSGRDHSADGG